MTAGTGQLRRDAWGIPHVVADDLDGLARAQGVATAVDRAWQLEVERRRSAGTLAALVGPDALEWDLMARRVGLDRLAKRAYRALDAPTARWLRAYVSGVNHALRAGLARADELDALGVDEPEPWRPWTPLGVLAVQHVLFGPFPHTLWRAHVAATLGAGAVPLLGRHASQAAGSNAFALTGERTASGAPLIAGDPHRLLEAPGVYQQVHLVCPGVDVVGLAFVGVPGVQHFGHACGPDRSDGSDGGSVAWAVTNAMADDQDLLVERLRRDGDTVLAADGDRWLPVPAWRETVEVAGADPVEVEIVTTPRGPVVTGGPAAGDGEGEGLALRTPALVLGDLGLAAVPQLLQARTVADVEAAWQHWVEPVNSVLTADSTGTVRRLVAGRVPARRSCGLPVPPDAPGWADWPGWATMPSTDVADLGGVAVAANDRRPGDTAELGSDFAAPHRATRIAALLDAVQEQGRRVDAEDCRRVLTDDLVPAGALRDLVTDLLGGGLTGPAADAGAAILAWDGRAGAGSTGAGLFADWRSRLVDRLAADPSLAALHAPSGRPALYAPWLDVRVRVGLALDTLVTDGGRLGIDVRPAAAAALADLAAAPAPAQPWGERHRLALLHALPAGHPARPELPAPALAGDGECVLATASAPGVGDRCSRGPAARYAWDLADRAADRWVVPLGASGRWTGRHATDQLAAWTGGQLLPVVDDLAATRADLVLPAAAARPFAVRTELLGEVRVDPLDPDLDAGLVQAWVNQERARFWGMTGHDVDDVREVYGFVDVLTSHQTWLVRAGAEPLALLQTYDPQYDPVGDTYPVRAGDVGIHLLVAPATSPTAGFSTVVSQACIRFVVEHRGARRIVVEPDVRNAKALARTAALGFVLGPEVDLGFKRARLGFLELGDPAGSTSGDSATGPGNRKADAVVFTA